MDSFAKITKDELCELELKSNCCKSSLLYGLLQFSDIDEDGVISHVTENENVIALYERLTVEMLHGECDIENAAQGYRLSISDRDTLFSAYSLFGDLMSFNPSVFKCDTCANHYFRGAFLCAGSVNSPESSFNLTLESPNIGASAVDELIKYDINFKYSVRGKLGILYLKDGESVEYFLHYIGARSAGFAMSDEKIRREIRANINRQNNFELANRQKAISAGQKPIDAIKKLIATNKIKMLPQDLQITAELKLANPDLNLNELANLHDPRITKSGLYHRLQRIIAAAEE